MLTRGPAATACLWVEWMVDALYYNKASVSVGFQERIMLVSNIEKYDSLFIRCLELDPTQLNAELVYQGVPTWDSVGHMQLISEVEETFDVMLDTDDIIDFSSYEVGKDILRKYDVEF